ncbi:MAG: hypothetical protein RLZZ543_1536 [Bacteroidota bacterium]|jgi:hypothetical protein
MFAQLSQFVKRVFAAPKKDEPVRQEMLVRSHAHKQQYKSWVEQGGHSEMLKNLYTAYTLNKLGITGDVPMHVFVNGPSRHVLLHYTDAMGKTLFPFLQDYFRDRIMRIGYNLYLSDRQTISRAGHTEQIDRHILRPALPAFQEPGKLEQLYGHITLSVHVIDERPLFLQISAETLQDKQYTAVFPFDELAETLFQ